MSLNDIALGWKIIGLMLISLLIYNSYSQWQADEALKDIQAAKNVELMNRCVSQCGPSCGYCEDYGDCSVSESNNCCKNCLQGRVKSVRDWRIWELP